MLKSKGIIVAVAIIILIAGGGWMLGRGSTNLSVKGVLPEENLGSINQNGDERLHILSDVPEGLPGIKIEKDLNVRYVYFCKGTYKAKQIFIGDVDVVARISNILKKDVQKNNWFCEMMLGRALDEGGILGNGEELDLTIEGAELYGISISLSSHPRSSFPFFIDTENNRILYTDGGILGTLK